MHTSTLIVRNMLTWMLSYKHPCSHGCSPTNIHAHMDALRNMLIDVFKYVDITSHTIINSLCANLHKNSLNHMNIPTSSVTQVHEYINSGAPRYSLSHAH